MQEQRNLFSCVELGCYDLWGMNYNNRVQSFYERSSVPCCYIEFIWISRRAAGDKCVPALRYPPY